MPCNCAPLHSRMMIISLSISTASPTGVTDQRLLTKAARPPTSRPEVPFLGVLWPYEYRTMPYQRSNPRPISPRLAGKLFKRVIPNCCATCTWPLRIPTKSHPGRSFLSTILYSYSLHCHNLFSISTLAILQIKLNTDHYQVKT